MAITDFPDLPPRAKFTVGERHRAFTTMGKRFVRWLGPEIEHDGNGYDPGPVFSEFDEANVKLCQKLMRAKESGVFSAKQWETLMTTLPDRDYRVTVEALNVRERAEIDARVVGFLHEDDVVRVTRKSRDKYWFKVKRRGLEGWSSHKFLRKVPVNPDALTRGTPWLTLARDELGVKEKVGSADNPRIVQYLRSTTLPASLAADDATHWCSAFVNFVLERSGFEGTDNAMARSWEHWGREIKVPQEGCVAVFERPEGGPSSGHVGFFVGRGGGLVSVLGGNQGDAVTIAAQLESRLLSYRMPG